MSNTSTPGELQNKFRELVEGCLKDTNATVHLEVHEGYDLKNFYFSIVVPNPAPPPEEPKKKGWFSSGPKYSFFFRKLIIRRLDLGRLFPEGRWHALSISVEDIEWIPIAEKIARAYSKETGAECSLAIDVEMDQ
jgi:hypothetical protein